MSKQDRGERTRGGAVLVIVALFATFPLLYLASLGPVGLLAERCDADNEWLLSFFGVVYTPAGWLADQESESGPYHRWLALWWGQPQQYVVPAPLPSTPSTPPTSSPPTTSPMTAPSAQN